MATLLEHGGKIDLWAGWSVVLPASYHQRNDDGSWSAWGSDWSVDVHIIEIAGDKAGNPVQPAKLLPSGKSVNAAGPGWIGSTEVLREVDNGRSVHRLAATLAAVNTVMSCWVSYFTESQRPFSESLVQQVTHQTVTPS